MGRCDQDLLPQAARLQWTWTRPPPPRPVRHSCTDLVVFPRMSLPPWCNSRPVTSGDVELEGELHVDGDPTASQWLPVAASTAMTNPPNRTAASGWGPRCIHTCLMPSSAHSPMVSSANSGRCRLPPPGPRREWIAGPCSTSNPDPSCRETRWQSRTARHRHSYPRCAGWSRGGEAVARCRRCGRPASARPSSARSTDSPRPWLGQPGAGQLHHRLPVSPRPPVLAPPDRPPSLPEQLLVQLLQAGPLLAGPRSGAVRILQTGGREARPGHLIGRPAGISAAGPAHEPG
jgi:hypothetical protein